MPASRQHTLLRYLLNVLPTHFPPTDSSEPKKLHEKSLPLTTNGSTALIGRSTVPLPLPATIFAALQDAMESEYLPLAPVQMSLLDMASCELPQELL